MPEPREEDRSVVDIDEDLAVAAGYEVRGPTGLVVGVLNKIREMLFQSGAADANDWPEELRPDQTLEWNSPDLLPTTEPEAVRSCQNPVVRPRTSVRYPKRDLVFLFMSDFQPGRVA
jgi:hypothetical protein